MIPIVVFGVVALALFGIAFLSKRRFGLLGLALAAGATLSTIWSYEAGLIVAGTGLVPKGEITQAVTQALVVLLPATLLLFHGYSYKDKMSRIIGALLFTLLALAFLVDPIGYALPLDGYSTTIYSWLKDNKNVIISVGIILAVIDLFFTKRAKHEEKHRGK